MRIGAHSEDSKEEEKKDRLDHVEIDQDKLTKTFFFAFIQILTQLRPERS